MCYAASPLRTWGSPFSRPFGGSNGPEAGSRRPENGSAMTTRTPLRSRRNLFRSTRFTPDEWALLRERAHLCGLPPSTYLRRVALGSKPEARPDAAVHDLLYHLIRIGNNLQQLDRLAQEQQRAELHRRLELTLEELKAAMERAMAPGAAPEP
jgi:Mobilization protein NikA